MEQFGLYSLLQTLLNPDSTEKTPPSPPNTAPHALPPQTEERPNPFLELMERHERLSRNIDRRTPP